MPTWFGEEVRVVIQLSPHAETASQLVSHVQEPEHAGPPQQSKTEKNTLGVFARILAGLSAKRQVNQSLAKNDTGEQLAGAETSKTAKSGEAGTTLHGAKKTAKGDLTPDALTGKTAAIDKKKTGAMEPELSQLELSEHAMLFTVSRLAGQNGEQGSKGRHAAATTGDASKTNTIPAVQTTPPAVTSVSAAEQGKQSLSAASVAAPELAENSRDGGAKRTKNRTSPAEALAQGDSAGRKTAGTVLSQQVEAKKTVSGEREGRNRLEEARNRRRSSTFDVRDYRGNAGQAEFIQRDGSTQVRVGAENRISGDGTPREITLELRLPNQGQESSSATTSWEAKAGQSFEDMLARELHQNFNNDIVRHASVALRDANEGTIRLALKPESLGNVKIRLEMTDNKITGYIVVESEEALRAFEREISSLEKAFRDSGFDDANLEMSLAGDNRGTEQQWQETEASRFLPEQFTASRYDAAIEQMEIPLTLDVYQQGLRAVNVLV